jgi:hypothetical protein
MPAAMTGAWLTTGGVLIVLLLLAGALLPRPYAEYPLLDVFDPAGSAKRKANRMAFKGNSPGEGRGQPGATKPDGKAPGGKSGEQGKGEGDKDGKDGKGDGKDGQGKDGKGKDGKGKSDSSGKSQSGDNKGEQGKGEQGKGEQGKGEQGKGEQGNQDKSEKSAQDEKSNKSKQGGRSGNPGNAAKGFKNMEQQQHDRQGSSPQSSSRLARVQQFIQRVAPVLKWIVFGVLAILVLLALFRGGLGFLANFTDWAKRMLDAWRNFWARLFGGQRTETAAAEEEIAGPFPMKERVLPFSSFSNPFDSGSAARMRARELVRYTVSALEAWARERDVGRREDETLLEFVARLTEEVPAIEAEAKRLAHLHARAEYAREKLPANTAEMVRAFWEKLDRVVAAPLSA